jgi:hypothetical protein
VQESDSHLKLSSCGDFAWPPSNDKAQTGVRQPGRTVVEQKLSSCVGMRVPNPRLIFLLAICPLTSVVAEQLIPLTAGTRWSYEMTQESSSHSLDLTEPNQRERFAVSYRIGGRLKVENNEFIKLELYRGDTLLSTDLITVDEHGIICSARIDENGRVRRFDPPQTLVRMPLKTGATWNFDGKIGETKVSQRYEITGEEDTVVAAGKFRAWRVRCEQTSPSAATIDRLFVPGTGFVKVTTKIRGPSGGVLQQTSLELKEAPKMAAQANVDSAMEKRKLSVGLSKGPVGDFSSTFSANTPAIYARWQGRGLRPQAKIRAVWIAENVADVAPDDQIDEASAVAPTPNSQGTFTISQPEGGWAPGNYRVEFYVDERLTEMVKLTITN